MRWMPLFILSVTMFFNNVPRSQNYNSVEKHHVKKSKIYSNMILKIGNTTDSSMFYFCEFMMKGKHE